MDIANNIKKRRLELGISQQSLADALGYQSRSSIAKIEGGQSDVPLSKLLDLARALDTSIESLLTGSISAGEEAMGPDAGTVKSERTAAVILAGGKSTRNLQNIPNQFINVLGKPVIIYCMEVYQRHPLIDEIFVVCAEGWESITSAYARRFGISKMHGTIAAGESGILSIYHGLQRLREEGYRPSDLVVLQEATRPFVTEEMISKLLRASRRNGSAVIGESMVDKVQFLVSDRGTDYINRDEVIDLQSPDAYTLDTLQEVFGKAQDRQIPLKDSCMGMLMSQLGYRLNFCEGSHNNMKIVRAEDITVFTALLKQRP